MLASPMLATDQSGPAAVDGEPNRPGVGDFYREILVSIAAAVRSGRVLRMTDVALVAAYFFLLALRADDLALGAWLVAAAVLAVASPVQGLVVLAAIAPFPEGLPVSRDIGAKSVLAGVLLASVATRWIAGVEGRRRLPAPVILAGLLLVGTGLGLVQTWARWGAGFANLASQTWIQGVGTMLVVFVVATWVARNGSLRPLAATLAATTAAGLVSLADFVSAGALGGGLLGWALPGDFNASRLTGVIRSPTSTAALVMLPASVYLAVVFLARDRWLRLAAAALAAPLLLAAYDTYNRAVFIALWLEAVIVGWRIHRRLGMAILAVGLAVSIVLVPWYVSLRGQTIGGVAQPAPGQLLIASDVQRLTAWSAATRMFLDRPLTGQGYRAYRQLSVEFGDPTLNAPHNEWLRLFAEQGVIVGVLGLAFAGVTAHRLARRPGWLETGILAAFVSFCLAACFNNPFLFNQVTIPAFVLAGTGVALAGLPDRRDTTGG